MKRKSLYTILIYFLLETFLISIISIFGININDFSEPYKTIAIMIFDLIPVIIIIYMYLADIKENLKSFQSKYLLIGIKYWIIGIAIMWLSSTVIKYFDSSIANNEIAVRNLIKTRLSYAVYSILVIAPIMEEFTFRKALQPLFKKGITFIITSGIIFGLLHVIASYQTPIDFLYIIPYGIMGSMFAIMLSKTNNIILPILFHFLHNTILLIIQIIIIFI